MDKSIESKIGDWKYNFIMPEGLNNNNPTDDKENSVRQHLAEWMSLISQHPKTKKKPDAYINGKPVVFTDIVLNTDEIGDIVVNMNYDTWEEQ